MSLTPQDIQSKQFHTGFRGFDVEEVDAFLERVAEEFLILNLEGKQAKEKAEALEKEIAHYKKQEKSFQKAILSAQKISDEMQSKSEEESRATLTRAREEAEQMVARAQEESEKIRSEAVDAAEKIKSETTARIKALNDEVASLEKMKEEAVATLRDTLNRYLAAIDNDPPGEIPPPSLKSPAPAPPTAVEPAEETAAMKTSPPPQMPEPEQGSVTAPETAAPITTDPDADDDLSDLYQKIDMLEQDIESNQPEPLDLGSLEPLTDSTEDDDNDLSIPDLDDKILFNLEDPLDDLEPSIAINSGKQTTE